MRLGELPLENLGACRLRERRRKRRFALFRHMGVEFRNLSSGIQGGSRGFGKEHKNAITWRLSVSVIACP
jgi:hypothetical protein